MKKVILSIFIVWMGLNTAYAGEKNGAVFFKKTVSEGSDLRVPLDTTLVKRVIIQLQNTLDSESVIYRSEFKDGKERPENKIGPKEFRTYTLQPKITDDSVVRKRDRKTIVLETADMDEVFLKIVKGSVSVAISEEKKKI